MRQYLLKTSLHSLFLCIALFLAAWSAPAQAQAANDQNLTDDPDEVATWIVLLDEKPAARYRGGEDGLMATSAKTRRDGRFQADSPEVTAYRTFLQERQRQTLGRISEMTGLSLRPDSQWQLAANGFSVEMSHREAQQVGRVEGVRRVFQEQELVPLTYAGPAHVGATEVWEGVADVVETRGEGVVVGIIDTGINPTHQSFAAAAPADGYEHENPLGEGQYLGVCDPNAPDHDPDFPCNSKLIGAYDYTGSGAADADGHGSHVAGTAAGNEMQTDDGVSVSGVAPRANVISYRICDGGCTGVLDVAEDILEEGLVDVINFSIGPVLGGGDPYGEASAQAFLSLGEAGVLVSAAGGNSGAPGTISNFAPWNLTVANSSHDGMMAHEISITGPGDDIPEALTEIDGLPGDNPPPEADIEAPILDAGAVGDALACEAFPSDSLDGAVALVRRGECQFAVKADYVEQAGALAMIVANDVPTAPVAMGGLSDSGIPSVMIPQSDGDAMVDWIAAEEDATVYFSGDPQVAFLEEAADVMSPSSSIGPGESPYMEIPGPNVSAPGTNILAAWHDADDSFNIISGTSMASPHAAGGLALMRSLYPDWNPQRFYSAFMLSANPDPMRKEDGQTPADVFDRGSGRLDLAAAVQAGLVMDETIDNFEAADPALDELGLHELNVAYLSQMACTLSCEWTRTVTATQAGSWEVLIDNDNEDFEISVSPAQFSLQAGESQQIEISALGYVPEEAWAFAELTLSETGDAHPDARLPVSIRDLAGPISRPAERSLDTGLDGTTAVAAGRENDLGVLWVGDSEAAGGDNALHAYDIDSLSATGASHAIDWLAPGSDPGAVSYSLNSESFWQVEIGGDNCLHEWHSEGGASGESICPAWPEAVRAVSHDPYERVFWAGGESGELYKVDHEGEILAVHSTDYQIAGLALSPLSGRLYVAHEGDEPYDIAALDTRDDMSLEFVFALDDADGNRAFGANNQSDIHLACDNRLWASHPQRNEVLAYDLGETDACPQASGDFDLDGVWVPGAGQTNTEYKTLRFVAPDQIVTSLAWDLTYDASQGNGRAGEFRMEIESPEGEVIRVGGRDNSAGALPDEELDYALGWPNESDAVASDSRSIDDFDGEQANGIWTVRLWNSFGLGLQYGLLTDDSVLALSLQLARPDFDPVGGDWLEEDAPLAVTITAPDGNADVRYTTDGSEPGPDHGELISSGETVAIDEDLTLQAVAVDSSGNVAVSDVQSADYRFHPRAQFETGDGEPITEPSLDAGETLVFQVTGGSGDFTAQADPNAVSGVEGELEMDGREGEFTVPAEGAFAGTYRITVIDEATGVSESLDVEVSLETSSERDHLVIGEAADLSVRGATVAYGFSFHVEQAGMPSDVASVDPEQSDAADDAPEGNPATTRVSVEQASDVEDFAVRIEPEDGSYTAVSHDMSADEGLSYSGWILDEDQDGLAAVAVSTATAVNPAEAYYAGETDEEGVFAFITPQPEADEARQLSASRSGYVTRQIDAADCEGSEPQCSVTLYQSTATIEGNLLGLMAGETARLYLVVTEPDGSDSQLGPHTIEGSGEGSDPFALDASHEAHYPAIQVRGFGYQDLTVDRDGDGFAFDSEDEVIADVAIDMVPTTPVVSAVSHRDRDDDSVTLVSEVDPNERATEVEFEWGLTADELGEVEAAGSLQASAGETEMTATVSDLSCGDTLHFRAIAENDQGVSGESEAASVAMPDCPDPDDPPPPSSSSSSGCSLDASRGLMDPVLPLFLLLSGLIILRRRV